MKPRWKLLLTGERVLVVDTSAMHPELIKAAIRMRGSNPTVIGAELGISRMTVSHVINGNGTSARVARRISEITGKPIGELWPGKYKKLVQGAA